MKDWRGTDVVVGSRVTYPVRFSSSMYVVEAEVREVFESGGLRVRRLRSSGWRGADIAQKDVSLTALANVTVIGGPS